MTGLSHHLRAFSELHHAMYAAADPLTGLRKALPSLSDLFQARHAAIDLLPLDGRDPELLESLQPEPVALPHDASPAFAPSLHNKDLVRAGGFSPVLRISDHLSQRQGEMAGFHQELPGPAGWMDRLGFAVQLTGETLEVSFLRERRFDEEETKVASQLQLYVAERFATPKTGPADFFQNAWRIPLDAAGDPPVLPFLARDLLERYFGPGEGVATALPKVLKHWVHGLRRRREHTKVAQVCGRIAIDRPHGRLHVGLKVVGPPQREVLCLQEELGRRDFFRLKALRLTEREIEVIFWITQGKSDTEIAMILGTAHKTINKHVEKLLMKLDANNRTSAAVRAVEWLADPSVEFGQSW